MKKIIASRVIVAGLNGVQQPVLADGHSPRLLASPPMRTSIWVRT